MRADLTPGAWTGGNGRPVDGSVPRRWREIEREAAAHRVRGISFIVEPSRRELIEIGRLIDAGVVRPIVESVLPLEKARADEGLFALRAYQPSARRVYQTAALP